MHLKNLSVNSGLANSTGLSALRHEMHKTDTGKAETWENFMLPISQQLLLSHHFQKTLTSRFTQPFISQTESKEKPQSLGNQWAESEQAALGPDGRSCPPLASL